MPKKYMVKLTPEQQQLLEIFKKGFAADKCGRCAGIIRFYVFLLPLQERCFYSLFSSNFSIFLKPVNNLLMC